MKRKNLNNALCIVLCTVGFIFIIIGIVNINTINSKNRVETIGIITNIDTYIYTKDYEDYKDYEERHVVYVKYKIDEKEYMSRTTNYYSSSFYVGKEVKLYYNKDNPNQVIIKESIILFSVIGTIFFTIGILGIICGIRKEIKQKNLIKNGKRIDAQYVKTRIGNYVINGNHPYFIVCEWDNPEDNKKYIFKSSNIWLSIDPERVIKNKKIKTFPVYINPKNKKQYVIDIKQLVEEVVDLT